MRSYPDLTALGYRHNDLDGHEPGGYCASRSKGRIKGWDDLLDQHLLALDVLTEKAEADGPGWGLTRPVLFEAHHVCELALKRTLARQGNESRSHRLDELWNAAEPTLPKRISPKSKKWLGGFISVMAELTKDGQDGRFPDSKTDISGQWCCINIPQMAECTRHLVFTLRGR